MKILADIAFGDKGNSADYILDGWGEAEPGHRWSLGPEATLRLPIREAGQDCVLILDLIPFLHPPEIIAQSVMIALNGRLLTDLFLTERRVLALGLPTCTASGHDMVLSLTHLNNRRPRTYGLYRDDRPLALMVLSVRLFQQSAPTSAPITYERLPGTIADGTLQQNAETLTGLSLPQLAASFESLGQGCEFGLVQRECGIEPLGLLRFANTPTPNLVNGICARFEGIGARETTRIFTTTTPRPEFGLHETKYYTWFSTLKFADETTLEAVQQEQMQRLTLLRRKFLEDLQEGTKIFVLTRSECLTEPEALAIYSALQLEGPNTLLWTTHGDATLTGKLECLAPGFLRGHLGIVDDRTYASFEAWLSVMANAATA